MLLGFLWTCSAEQGLLQLHLGPTENNRPVMQIKCENTAIDRKHEHDFVCVAIRFDSKNRSDLTLPRVTQEFALR